jgi:tetratricopeptide (TPR) repeat protein
MPRTAINNLIFTDISSYKRSAEPQKRVSQAGLYQGIAQTLIRGFHTEQSLANLSKILVSVADHTYLMRQFEIVGAVGRLLVAGPFSRELEHAGHYYQALNLNRKDRDHPLQAEYLFMQVAHSGPTAYRARAMLALGTNQVAAGNHKSAISFYREVVRVISRDRAFDPVTLYFAGQMTAVIKAIEGDHRGALDDLQGLLPLVRSACAVQPYTYYDYLNSLAVELGEAGRLDDARRASEIALRSRYSSGYPNWRETLDDILVKQRSASRSFISVSQQMGAAANLINMPVAAQAVSKPADRDLEPKQARVLSFQQWKTMLKGSNRTLVGKLTPEQRKRMTTGEKLIRLMDLISQDNTDDETIDRILEAVEGIIANRQKQ